MYKWEKDDVWCLIFFFVIIAVGIFLEMFGIDITAPFRALDRAVESFSNALPVLVILAIGGFVSFIGGLFK